MIMLSEAKFFMLNNYFWDKNGLLLFNFGLLLFNFGYVAKVINLTINSLFLLIFIDKIVSSVSYGN